MEPEAAPLPPQLVDLLHYLGFIYLVHGQANRAAILLMAASRADPGRVQVLTTLSAALIEAGLGSQAMEVVRQIDELRPDWRDHRMVQLLRSHALLLEGDPEGAVRTFRTLAIPEPEGEV